MVEGRVPEAYLSHQPEGSPKKLPRLSVNPRLGSQCLGYHCLGPPELQPVKRQSYLDSQS